MKRLPGVLLLMCAWVHAGCATAHEVRPAYLEIDQTGLSSYKVLWKQPTLGNLAVHLVPHISNGWLDQPPADQYAAAGFLIRTWVINTPSPESFAGRSVTIEGLENTITDTLVRVRLLNGQHLEAIARPETPSVQIDLAERQSAAISAFLLLGIEHILTGPDHLLFVLGIILIVRDRRALLQSISAFTLAHSLTLAGTTLGAISLSVPLVNSLIALSILFVGAEIIRSRRGETSLTLRYPWGGAFAFGLLHGMGFASGLASLALDRSALVGALVMFNAGVEIGQLAFIVLVFALQRAFALMEIHWPRAIAVAPCYVIGIFGAAWSFQYGTDLLGLSGQ